MDNFIDELSGKISRCLHCESEENFRVAPKGESPFTSHRHIIRHCRAEVSVRMHAVGPRMVLNPIRIFRSSFGGETLYQNPKYQSPNQVKYPFSFFLYFLFYLTYV